MGQSEYRATPENIRGGQPLLLEHHVNMSFLKANAQRERLSYIVAII